MRSISNSMLVCSCSLQHVESINADRKPTYSDAIELSNVWITVSKSVVNGSYGKENSDVMTLFYDCYNSKPTDITFKQGDKVTFNSKDYYITTISPCYDTYGKAHIEIGLK